jgi:fumarate hydratase subunit beta
MKLTTPLTDDLIERLHAGDKVSITGVIYVGRDSAHKRLVAALDAGQPLPFDPHGQIIYYMGPSPAKPGDPIGSAGPTTSGRMDAYTPRMLEAGLKGMVGKGNRTQAVRDAIRKYKAVYMAATGGAGALIAESIRKSEIVAYAELGAEALLRLEVVDFPAIVVNDIYGGDAYEDGVKQYNRE